MGRFVIAGMAAAAGGLIFVLGGTAAKLRDGPCGVEVRDTGRRSYVSRIREAPAALAARLAKR